MKKLTIVVALLSALVLCVTNAQAQTKTAPKAIKLTPIQVASQFDKATQAATDLAKHPTLGTAMPENLAKLAECKKLQAKVDQLVAALPNMSSKERGAAAADAKRLQQKAWEMMESIADSEIDEAKDNYEEAKEQFKLAMRILSEHMERQTQVIQKITS